MKTTTKEKQPKSYVVTQEKAFKIIENCESDTTDFKIWKAIEDAFPGAFEQRYHQPITLK